MEDITDQVIIKAPLERVWEAIRDPGEHAEWHPLVTSIAGEHALGSTRTCSILAGNKPGTTQERCSTYDEARKIMWTIEQDSTGFSRMVSHWRAGFSLEPQGPDATRVTAQSLFTPKRFFARLLMPGIRRRFHQTQRAILAGLKQHVEG